MGASRRTILTGIAAGGVAVPLVAACGSSATPDTSTGTATTGTTTGSTSTDGKAIGKTSDIPVGGGKVFDSASVVVTQPTAGQFKAFTAICTHQGCLVDRVVSGQIKCPCHGSVYSATDGSVINGPANRPLAAKSITVSNGEILLG